MIMTRISKCVFIEMVNALTSDDVNSDIGQAAHTGVTGVVTRVSDPRHLDQETGAGDQTLLRHLADPTPGRTVGDWLK